MQGRQWEESGEYQRAVECYLKIDALATRSDDILCFERLSLLEINDHCLVLRDVNILAAAWTKAAEIAIKFLDTEKATGVAGVVGPRLVEIGRLSKIASLHMSSSNCCHQVQCCCSALSWSRDG